MRKILFLCLLLINHIYPEEVHNLPIYTLNDDRNTIHSSLESFKDEKLLVINFTNSTCKPCKIEIPKLIQLHEKLKNKGLVLWIVFIGDNNDTIEPILKELKIPETVKVFKDPLEIAYKRLNFKGVPANFVIKKNKDLSYTSIGYTEAKQKKLEEKIGVLLNEN